MPTRQDIARATKGTIVSEVLRHSLPEPLALNTTHQGDNRELIKRIPDNSVGLSVWSPPYFVGKDYEAGILLEDWEALLRTVISEHFRVLRPGGFMAINMADILAFSDDSLPRFQADVVSTKRSKVTRQQVLEARIAHPEMNRHQLAALLGCSEQTIQRRLDHNNVRGGKYKAQTRIKTVAGMLEEYSAAAGMPMYDRRVWVKDPAWANSRWHSLSYRAVDEFEYIFIFWKPGITRVDRTRLRPSEWSEWGSRGVWRFPSVRANGDHEAKFPLELPTRLIRLLTDPEDLVLDPFMGSGTTGVAAINQNRDFLGFEMLPEYVSLANTNCQLAMERNSEPQRPTGLRD